MTFGTYATAILAGASLCAMATAAAAQDTAPAAPAVTAAAEETTGFDEIIVTATKRGTPSNVQSVPFAVTAFGTKQLDDQHVRNLQDLSFSIPNVQLEDVGTAPGYANFSIRGLGINSSIPSIDPTVGVFIDGIYMGISAGILFDNFDLAGVEVLRGPQGLLFGRNVTGGAVVVRTSTPGDTLRVDARASVETGLNKTVSGVISGPLIEGKLAAKLAVYYNDDDGYFTNQFNGNKDFGANETLIVRGALRFTPSDTVELIARYEHGRTDGDGAVVSNFGLFPRDSFGVRIDEEGRSDSNWDQAILEANIQTGFGDGVITNVFGYREYQAFVTSDIDSSPSYTFHADTLTRQHQYSNELRYAGTFGKLEITTGLYYFEQYINYLESRRLAGGALRISGGGVQDQSTYGAFISTDYHVTDTITLNGGVRYSYEKKRVRVANLIGNLCDPIVTKTCSNYGFADTETWQDPTYKIGAQYQPTEDTQIYGLYARGFRSGGYNFRNGNINVAPGPFDSEKQDSFELGLKQEFGRTVRLNAAIFHNTVKGLQREIITPVLPIGTTQVIRNSADVRIQGFEAELLVRVDEHLTLSGQVGYTDGKYTKIFFDLNANGVINAADFALKPPRLAPWTYGGAINYTRDIGSAGSIGLRLAYDHRDASFSNDANTGLLSGANMIDANLSFTTADDRVTVSAYARNLLDEQTEGNVSPLPFFAGSTFSSINKGRVYGGEVTYKF